MKEFASKMFRDESGNPSSNRVFGALVIIVGLVLACFGKSIAIGVLTAGAGLLGAGQLKSAFIGAAVTKTTTKKTETVKGDV